MLKGYIIQNRLINDTIYNHIEYTKLEDKILQTKILNRLQFITQNALAYFSFPSITFLAIFPLIKNCQTSYSCTFG